MNIYPSLEDMKVDQAQQVLNQINQDQAYAQMLQNQEMGVAPPSQAPSFAAPTNTSPAPVSSGLYPSLAEYMGMDLASASSQYSVVPMPQYQPPAVPSSQLSANLVAPISQQNLVGIQRSEIKQGLRQVILCKDAKGLVGMKIKSVQKGVFVAHVTRNSPAALAGLRFGDQILDINNETLAGYSSDKVHKILKKANPERIELVVRDRPFERTVTLQKDSHNHVGFIFKDGKIASIVKDSSAARNGLLIDHQLCEVNGQCVIGLKDKDILEIMQNGGNTVTITIMPSFVYEHIVKRFIYYLTKNLIF